MRFKSLVYGLFLSIVLPKEGLAMMTMVSKNLDEPFEYSINLMWVNKDKDEKQRYICPGDKDSLLKKIISPAMVWLSLNPNAQVCVWYDGAMLSKKAVKKTKKALKQSLQSLMSEKDLQSKVLKGSILLKNIRELTLVSSNDKVFSSTVPIYFRVDLLRVIAFYELAKEKTNFAFVYADLDLSPIALDDKLNKSKSDLENYGIVMAEGTHAHKKTGYIPYYENSFQIMYSNPNFLRALKEVMVDVSINEALEFLSKSTQNIQLNKQFVYELYEQVFAYYHCLQGNGKLYYRLDVVEKYLNQTGELYETFRVDLEKISKMGLVKQFERFEKCGFKIHPQLFIFEASVEYQKMLYIRRKSNVETGEEETCLFVPRLKLEIPPSQFLEIE